jgi:hypothetical protein
MPTNSSAFSLTAQCGQNVTGIKVDTNPRAIQEAMGQKSLETTMAYLHSESLSVDSPLESTLP